MSESEGLLSQWSPEGDRASSQQAPEPCLGVCLLNIPVYKKYRLVWDALVPFPDTKRRPFVVKRAGALHGSLQGCPTAKRRLGAGMDRQLLVFLLLCRETHFPVNSMSPYLAPTLCQAVGILTQDKIVPAL